MPATKKHKPVNKKPKRSTPPSPKPDKKISPEAIQDIQNEAKPPTNSELPPAQPKDPLPMPVKPQQLPSKVHQPLTKTTYNAAWIKRLAAFGLLGVLLILGYIAWDKREFLTELYNPAQEQIEEPYHLSITPTPTPDQQKLDAIAEELNGKQSSTTAQPSTAGSAEEFVRQLDSMSTAELEAELALSIDKLSDQGISVINLQSYMDKFQNSKQGNDETSARSWLIEGLMHARELELLHTYYESGE